MNFPTPASCAMNSIGGQSGSLQWEGGKSENGFRRWKILCLHKDKISLGRKEFRFPTKRQLYPENPDWSPTSPGRWCLFFLLLIIRYAADSKTEIYGFIGLSLIWFSVFPLPLPAEFFAQIFVFYGRTILPASINILLGGYSSPLIQRMCRRGSYVTCRGKRIALNRSVKS